MKYAIIGASAAGINAAKTLREIDPSSEIILISEDKYVYSRCMLHHLIRNEKSIEGLNFVGSDFFSKNNIQWLSDCKVEKLYPLKKELLLANNQLISFDKLLIASGASSFFPPIKNLKEGKGILGLRTLDDALAIKTASKDVNSALIVGGGLVGIDATLGLLDKNIKLSIVELSDRLLPLQLDQRASSRYEKLLKEKGVDILTQTALEEVVVNDKSEVIGAKLSNGEYIDCNLIVIAAGIRPNLTFIANSEISIDKGILVNEKCETSCRDIYAAGDVTGKTPIWPIAVKQGKVAAYNMAGKEKSLDDFFAFKNSMNFLGLDTISVGFIEPPDASYSVDILENSHIYKKIISKDGCIVGAILQGDISYAGVLTHLIKSKIDISKINKSIFELDYSDFFSVKSNGEFQYAR